MSEISRWPAIDAFVLVTDSWTKPFWDAAAEHRLVVTQCGACGRRRMPPSPFCPGCRSQAVAWPEVKGPGTIYSFTVVASAVSERQKDHVPYVPALIEFAEAPGVRIVSAIVEAPIAEIAIGAEVDLVWQDRADGVAVPRFKLRART